MRATLPFIGRGGFFLCSLAILTGTRAAENRPVHPLNHRLPAYVELSDPLYAVFEDQTNAVVTVIRTGEYRERVSIDYSTLAGSAAPGEDYTVASGTLEIPAGVGVVTFSVPLIGDNEAEPAETVEVRISCSAPNVVITRATAILRISDAPTPSSPRGNALILTVEKAGNGRIVLSWPANAAGCVLERASSPAEGAWQSVRAVPQIQRTRCRWIESAADGPVFYRLRAPD